ncbi:MAG: transposase [Endomicrobiales bacterium]|nr:transposase [Endomicrobiales bacterium]
MVRIARVVGVGLPHHVTQRGNYRQEVFSADTERNRYLAWIKEYSRKYELSILAYCLMDNHVHFIAVPRQENSLAMVFNMAHMRYSQYKNRKHDISGHLWQGRFYSCILDEQHLMEAARYIERNPVKANLVEKPWDWQWSSAAVHIGKEPDRFFLNKLFDHIPVSSEEWRGFIDVDSESSIVEAIKKHTCNGRPLGSRAFVEKIEKNLGVTFQVPVMGRPKKKK